MKTLELVQGSPEWLAHRATHFNASDAPAMLGCSPHKTRAQLMHELHTGLTAEVDPATQRRYDDGHRFEALARPLAMQIIGEDLYPVVGTEGKYSASFDGLTMAEDVAFEHKSLNSQLKAALMSDAGADALPKAYRVQMEQQLMVSGAERVLFMASKWEDETLVEELHAWYVPDAELRAEIIAGWAQFEQDMAAYVPPEATAPAPTGRTMEALPALRIEVTGEVTASNLAQYREHAFGIFATINRELTTDQQFADAEKTVKWCGDVEERLAAAKQHALSQTETIDALFRTIDEISGEARRVRLDLDKLVKARKEQIRVEIVREGTDALAKHVEGLNARLGKPYMPQQFGDFAAAIKGKRTVDSMRDAVSTTLANAKIAASAIADKIQTNLATLREQAAEHLFLFPDTQIIVQKAPDDLATLVKSRIAEHQEKERQREEAQRERIAREERAKAEAAVRAEQEAQRRADEQAAREQAAQVVQQAAATPPPAAPNTPAAAVTPPRPTPSSAPAAAAPAAGALPTLSLGTIKTRIAPIQITADGLTQLGFTGVKERGSVLYHEHQYPQICAALIAHLEAALEAQPA